ncbi:hypothetical protein FRB98_007637 [Tulasnella sp. 332]|nr:hypothetical protein FRB98_007637 [Tulasnella sp. 332]
MADSAWSQEHKLEEPEVEDIQVQPLLRKTLSERRELLRQAFVPVEGEFGFATSSDSESVEDI